MASLSVSAGLLSSVPVAHQNAPQSTLLAKAAGAMATRFLARWSSGEAVATLTASSCRLVLLLGVHVQQRATSMIGPSIPEHLLKKQGTSDATGEEEQSSTSASNNIRSSGPQAPGPQDDSDDDDFGPALPPELAAARISKPADPSVGPSRPSVGPSRPPAGPERPAAGPSRPTAGPSLPAGPAPPSRRPVDDDSDDDDVGPMPLPAGVADASRTDGVQEFMERERRQQESAAAAERERLEGKKPKREEWMLVPPKESDLLGSESLCSLLALAMR